MNPRSKKRLPGIAVYTIGLCALGFTVSSHVELHDQYVLARGGRLYDHWISEIEADHPQKRHVSYPEAGTYARKTALTWRCQECHGWDYKGAAGAYRAGTHFTGIKGIQKAIGMPPETIVELLKSPTHAFGDKLSDQDLDALALFVSQGQADLTAEMDLEGVVKGDTETGRGHFQNLCSACHGISGREIDDMPVLGALSRRNPWECFHKILNGAPGTQMPAFRSLDRQVSIDILAYLQTLPDES